MSIEILNRDDSFHKKVNILNQNNNYSILGRLLIILVSLGYSYSLSNLLL